MIFRLLVGIFGSVWKLKEKSKYSKNQLIRRLSQLIYGGYQYENGSSIAWNSSFMGEPCFPHGMKSIFISGDAIIGKNCVIFQQVVIGSVVLLDSQNSGSPKVGDNCYIGAGAKIIGAVTIGNNVRIGANTVVYKDVPDNSIVVSNEQRIITRDVMLDNKFYTNSQAWQYYDDGNWINADEVTKDKLSSIIKENKRNEM
ncbi:MAG: serine O-acetyltransferase [Polaribacter sp.]|jgi:serine O-acetyltransferase